MASICGIAATILAIGFLFAPQAMLKSWELDAQIPTQFMARRIGANYLGLAIMFFLGRSAPPSALRDAVCIGLAVGILALPVLSFLALKQGLVSNGVIPSIVVEVVLALGLISTVWSQT